MRASPGWWDRLSQAPEPDAALLEQCTALLQEIEANPSQVAPAFEKYRLLAAQAAALLAAGSEGTTLKAILAEELTVLRDEILSPVLAEERHTELRAKLLAQCASLEEMIAGQPIVAKQGLALLRERLYRELQQQADAQQRRLSRAEEVRTLVGEALAKLQAVIEQEQPEFSAQATVLLERFSIALAQQPDDLATLHQLAELADQIFTGYLHFIEAQTVTSYVGDQISDVLLTLGYRVSQIAPENPAEQRAYVAEVGDDLGLAFRLDGQGQLKTELVALNEQAAGSGQAAQERICTLTDKIFAALRARDCTVRERFRSSLTPGEKLRVMEATFDEERPAVNQEELKQMSVESEQ